MRKAHHLVLEGRTVAWPNSRDLAVIKGRFEDVFADQGVDAIGRVNEMTRNLRPADLPCQKRKRHGGFVTALFLEPREINPAAMQTWWRPRLQTSP